MSMSRKTVLITGATAGLGRCLAEQLADRGARLMLHGRDEKVLAAQCRDFRAKGVEAHPLVADFSALSEVHDLAGRLEAQRPTVDVLINNAGVGPGTEGAGREISKDGHELRFAVGYLAPYLLTRLLLPALRRSPSARVVNVGSAAQAEIDLADLEMATSYQGWIAYGRAKLALASFTVDLAEEVGAEGIAVSCVHPADLMPTALVRETGLEPASTIEQGAEAVLRLACSPVGETAGGQYFHGLTPAAPHDDVMDPDKRRRLREATERLLAD
ncbi:SDR family NAD(P)-dependent oxidoreductase [Streptomyces afghaniensis]|uniref:SDR family NAD(P)-dependent oxidoreductase n=1 Tax=Streptomyces afghaniensis TaxID=66865 RepID=UPI0027872196|nr:SDR family NAD(P)-dependent oxidoreductase [Streptomyces afghaniensis]MDQ1018097.1 NAD(P)-dependent dehydrogenase (short-subunit alcohol dehydrogenase family) [Streptomyces afghaniensis]